MKLYYLCLTVLILGWAVPGQGEFYKYKNSQGVVVFTDDLAKVPENQRENLSAYEETNPTPASGQKDGNIGNGEGLEQQEGGNQNSVAEDNEEQSTENSDPDVTLDSETADSEGNAQETLAMEEGNNTADPAAEEAPKFENSQEADGTQGPAKVDSDLGPADRLNQEKTRLDQEYLALKAEKESLVKNKPNGKSKEEMDAYHEKIVDINERISNYENRRKTYSDQVDAYNSGNKE